MTFSLNMHTIGMHFIEKVTVDDHTFLTSQVEFEQTSLTDTRFQATIRGWGNKAQQHRAASLLAMTDDRMIAVLQ
jgi:hypothetical protein